MLLEMAEGAVARGGSRSTPIGEIEGEERGGGDSDDGGTEPVFSMGRSVDSSDTARPAEKRRYNVNSLKNDAKLRTDKT